MGRSIRVEWMMHAVEQHRRVQTQGSPSPFLRYARAQSPEVRQCVLIAIAVGGLATRMSARKSVVSTCNGANEQKLFEWNYQLLQGSSGNSLRLT
jgi:hypothetical protein